MIKIPCMPLSLEAMQGLGSFRNLTCPEGFAMGQEPVVFYRDMLWNTFGTTGEAAFSVVQTRSRPLVVTEMEQHLYTAEALLPLDGDVVVCVGAATNRTLPDVWKAFYVPKGTMVIFDRGVWHKAPFPVNQKTVHSLVVLPPMTYAKDCYVLSLAEADTVVMELPNMDIIRTRG